MEPYKNGATTGSEAVNGSKSSAPSTASVDTGEKLASLAKPKPTPRIIKSTKADRKGVKNVFEQYAQVIQATVQPLPTQDGTGTKKKEWGKILDDLKGLRGAGMSTI